MDLKGLQACSIAEHGSLTRAATALELAQSVLSRRISALEEELGTRVFHRTGRGVALTSQRPATIAARAVFRLALELAPRVGVPSLPRAA